jgi:hypothetical protein
MNIKPIKTEEDYKLALVQQTPNSHNKNALPN